MHNNVISRLPKTNNSVEGWHRGFEEKMANHPNIWTFIECIKKQQKMTEVVLEQKKDKDYEEIIFNLASQFDNGKDILEYLKGIAHNLSQ